MTAPEGILSLMGDSSIDCVLTLCEEGREKISGIEWRVCTETDRPRYSLILSHLPKPGGLGFHPGAMGIKAPSASCKTISRDQ